MEAEEFIEIYEYLKNEHEEEMAERYEEVMDVQYGIKLILEELQEIREVLGLEKKRTAVLKRKKAVKDLTRTQEDASVKNGTVFFLFMVKKIK